MTQSTSSIEFSTNGDKADPERLAQLTAEHFQNHCLQVWRRTDRMFAGLMALQWLAGIGVALWITPRTWIGATSSLHLHVLAAIFLGGAIAVFPILLVFFRPGQAITRHVIAVAQMLASVLLIASLEDGSKLISTFLAPWRFSPFIGTGASLSRRRL